MTADPRAGASPALKCSCGRWHQAAPEGSDAHDVYPGVGQCCNYASRQAFGDCRYCKRTRAGASSTPQSVQHQDAEIRGLRTEVARLREALNAIVICECRFRRDPLEHSREAVEYCQTVAREALAPVPSAPQTQEET